MSTLSILSTSGIRLMADVEGAEKLPTVLFLHAGGENREVWRPIATDVTRLGWRTVAIDLRGHGESDRAPDYRIDDFIDDVVTVLAQSCGKPVVIVGGSIGGILGLIVAGESHAKVDGLVLLDIATRLPGLEGPKAAVRRIASAKERGLKAVASVDPKYLNGSFLEDVMRDPGRWGRAARRLKIPVLLIGGESSPQSLEAAEAATREDIPHVEVEYVPGGHLVARDCPTDVSRLLMRFLQRSWTAYDVSNRSDR